MLTEAPKKDFDTLVFANSVSDNHLLDAVNTIKPPDFKQKSTLPYMGVELEVEPSDNSYSNFVRNHFKSITAFLLNKIAIVKHDGSLHNGGFEICSIPMTLRSHKTCEKWSLWFETVKQTGVVLHRGVYGGMHVHVNANAVLKHEGLHNNIKRFFHTNKQFIEVIAERQATEFCKYPTAGQLGDNMLAHNYDDHHYSAIHHKSQINTIEFRIFRNVTDIPSFFKNLEFVQTMITYFRYSNDMSSATYCNFVMKNKTRYPYLYEFLHKLNYI